MSANAVICSSMQDLHICVYVFPPGSLSSDVLNMDDSNLTNFECLLPGMSHMPLISGRIPLIFEADQRCLDSSHKNVCNPGSVTPQCHHLQITVPTEDGNLTGWL